MKKAFTLLELVFIIVVIGILAATVIPRVNTDRLTQAAIQVVSHIRYTQHLAINDDKYDAIYTNSSGQLDWYKSRWQFIFGYSETDTDDLYAYTIFSDSFSDKSGDPDFSSLSHTEIAIDPSNMNKVLSGGYNSILDWESEFANKKLNLGKSYGVTDMSLSEGCRTNGKRISFDHLGRPIEGATSSLNSPYGTATYRRLVKNDNPCLLTLTSLDGSVSIKIEAETGYACILDSSNNCVKY